MVKTIAKRRQNLRQIRLQPPHLHLRHPRLGLDVRQPAQQFVAGAPRHRQPLGQRLYLFLALAQEHPGAGDLVLAIGPRQIARLKGHLHRQLQQLRLQMGQVGMRAQMRHPRPHRIERARQRKDAAAVGVMGKAAGPGHILHADGKTAVAALQPGHARLAGRNSSMARISPVNASSAPMPARGRAVPPQISASSRQGSVPEACAAISAKAAAANARSPTCTTC
jgi:hypothetical protein